MTRTIAELASAVTRVASSNTCMHVCMNTVVNHTLSLYSTNAAPRKRHKCINYNYSFAAEQNQRNLVSFHFIKIPHIMKFHLIKSNAICRHNVCI